MQHDEDDIPADLSTLIRLGPVTAVQLDPPRIKMRYGDPDADDGEIETPWVRFVALRAGKTRKSSFPSEGEEGVLLCPDGQVGNGIFLPGLYNGRNKPHESATLENDVTAYEDGALIGYDPASHALTAILPDGATATIKASGGITLDGPVHITGKLTSDADIEAAGDVKGAGISLQGHKHPGITRGGALSDPPQG